MSGCEEYLEESGQCDLEEGHFPETLHLLVTGDRGIWWKVIWPLAADDPDVERYMAVADAYEAEDNRRLAAQRASGG